MTPMRKPPALRRGDRVAVVAPASPLDRDVFLRGVEELRTLGFEPIFDEGVFARDGYLAGPAAHRAAALRAAWNAEDVAAVFAARGGYGSAQLLPLLDASEMRRAPKPFVGGSDLTALLAYLALRCETVCFHGPMLLHLAERTSGYDRRSLLGCVAEPAALGDLRPDGVERLNGGAARGVLLGGTLTQLLASLGTPFAFEPPPGYVLFLDDVGEAPYRIDRMMTQLRQAGLLARASAVVCAEFPRCGDGHGRDARSVLARSLADFPGPVLFGFPSGHTRGPTLTLPFGATVTVTAAPRPGLTVEEPAVA